MLFNIFLYNNFMFIWILYQFTIELEIKSYNIVEMIVFPSNEIGFFRKTYTKTSHNIIPTFISC